MLKKYFSLSHFLFAIIFIFVLINQAPLWTDNFKKEGLTLETKDYLVLNGNAHSQKISFPGSKKSVVIFWATWCGPCKVEMKRLAASVRDGNMSKASLIAINPFEDAEIIAKFLSENSYAKFFTFIEAPEVARILNIKATPTMLFIEKRKVTHLSSGMSLLGILKAERFLK